MTNNFSNVPYFLYLLRGISNWTPGKTRISNLFFNFARTNHPFFIKCGELDFYAPSLVEPVSKCIVSDGVYDHETLEVLKKNLKKESVFIDLGANIGFFSVIAAKTICTKGSIISVEASPKIFNYFTKNIESNQCQNIKAYNNAIHHSLGSEISFYDAPDEKFGMGGLANRFGSNEVKVQTTTLDALVIENKLSKVDLIKIDVEGFELEAFMGGKELLSSPSAPTIVFEFNDWSERERQGATPGDAQKFLRSLGYKIQEIKGWLKKPCDSNQIMTQGSANLVAWK